MILVWLLLSVSLESLRGYPVLLPPWGCWIGAAMGHESVPPPLPMHAPDLDAAHVTVHGVCVQMYLQTEH